MKRWLAAWPVDRPQSWLIARWPSLLTMRRRKTYARRRFPYWVVSVSLQRSSRPRIVSIRPFEKQPHGQKGVLLVTLAGEEQLRQSAAFVNRTILLKDGSIGVRVMFSRWRMSGVRKQGIFVLNRKFTVLNCAALGRGCQPRPFMHRTTS